jgi:hypothetical protein
MTNDMLANNGPSALQIRFEMQAGWRDVVAAAGLDSPQHMPEHTYALVSAILHDPVVAKMRLRPEFEIREMGTCAVETNWRLLFEKLAPGGRAALKDRIAKAHGIGVTVP